jgi:hypothetical protein
MIVGTFLYAWWTARGAYKWSFESPTTASTHTTLLFGDADGDGSDDLVQTVGDHWYVSLSNGVDGWSNASLWWRDQQPAGSERFLLPGGTAAAAVYSTKSAAGHTEWTVGIRAHAYSGGGGGGPAGPPPWPGDSIGILPTSR